MDYVGMSLRIVSKTFLIGEVCTLSSTCLVQCLHKEKKEAMNLQFIFSERKYCFHLHIWLKLDTK